MATAVSICSNALLMLGANTINDLQENSDRARFAANLYEDVRDSMLRAHPWNCALKRLLLAPITQAPAFGWQYSFELPADCLRVLGVTSGGAMVDYVIEGRSILANQASIELRYVFRNDVEATWDPALVQVMTLAMAAKMAYFITQSTSMEQSRLQELDYELRKARAIDGQEEPAQTFGDFPLLQSRYSYGGNW